MSKWVTADGPVSEPEGAQPPCEARHGDGLTKLAVPSGTGPARPSPLEMAPPCGVARGPVIGFAMALIGRGRDWA